MLAIFFNIVNDWVLRFTTAHKSRRIQWTLFSTIQLPDFEDDPALLTYYYRQELTTKPCTFSHKWD